MSQTDIWVMLTIILTVARFTNITYTVDTIIHGRTFTKYYWKGDWLKGVLPVWFVISAILYLLK